MSRGEGPGWNRRPFGLNVVKGRVVTLAMQEDVMVLDDHHQYSWWKMVVDGGCCVV